METKYLYVTELAFISDRLRQVFERNAGEASADMTFKELQHFQRSIRSWHREFIKPPMLLVANCDLERLTDFYRRRLDFSLFQHFTEPDFEVIQQEIAAYVAREALDALIGYRLRNWATIGLQNPKWKKYRTLVHRYYEKTISNIKKEKLSEIKNTLIHLTNQTSEEIWARCVGDLFFEVDRVRLMPTYRFERHLAHIQQREMGRDSQSEAGKPTLNIPDRLRDSFQFFGFTNQIDANKLKDSYRQLALSYHPDKGGSLEMMQKLNDAYQQIADYLRQSG